jgi:hypothetical protein
MVNEDFQLVAVGVELLRGVDVEGSENNGAPDPLGPAALKHASRPVLAPYAL